MLAPVIIFVYNRPEHTKKTIRALAENYNAKETDVYIFCDGFKSDLDNRNIKLVRKYIDSVPEKKHFKKVVIRKADVNKGLANSVIDGVSEIIQKYGRAIVLEDDLVSTKDFLQYMNSALEYYKNNESIWSISGYNIPIDIPSDYSHDVYLSYRACSWGWATWRDRWGKVDWDVIDYNDFKNNQELRKKINRGGRDMANMLDMQMQGEIDSWAIRWCYTQSKFDMATVYPVESRIKNIGLDGSGTHSGVNSHYDIELNSQLKSCNFDDPGFDKRILKRFQNHYMSLLKFYLIKPKAVIKRLLRE